MKAAYKSSKPAKSASRSGGGYSYVDRNLAAMSPDRAQTALQPTPAEPVNLHKRMAGCK
jgi:hypothetical protein